MTFIQYGMRTKTCTSEFTYTVCLVCNHFTILSNLIDCEQREIFTHCSFFIAVFMSIKWCNFLLEHLVSGIMVLNIACKKEFKFSKWLFLLPLPFKLLKKHALTFIFVKIPTLNHTQPNIYNNAALKIYNFLIAKFK